MAYLHASLPPQPAHVSFRLRDKPARVSRFSPMCAVLHGPKPTYARTHIETKPEMHAPSACVFFCLLPAQLVLFRFAGFETDRRHALLVVDCQSYSTNVRRTCMQRMQSPFPTSGFTAKVHSRFSLSPAAPPWVLGWGCQSIPLGATLGLWLQVIITTAEGLSVFSLSCPPPRCQKVGATRTGHFALPSAPLRA
jgi:hypothetical protein